MASRRASTRRRRSPWKTPRGVSIPPRSRRKLRAAWRSIELGDFNAAARPVNKAIKGRDPELKAAAELLFDAVRSEAEPLAVDAEKALGSDDSGAPTSTSTRSSPVSTVTKASSASPKRSSRSSARATRSRTSWSPGTSSARRETSSSRGPRPATGGPRARWNASSRSTRHRSGRRRAGSARRAHQPLSRTGFSPASAGVLKTRRG